jgi:exopolyphosphatase/guanosine-5'-triphosphate,3'-diphosphate pyrophosphatase
MFVDRPRSAGSSQLHDIHRWVRHRLGDTRHEQRVTAIAARLFDLTAPLHGLGRRHRRLLKLGALLHDVGRRDGAADHHRRGARMILRGRGLWLTESQRSAAAFLARYHRGRLPYWGEDPSEVKNKSRRQMLMLLGLLRAADALDYRALTPPTLTMRLRGDRLSIACHTDTDPDKARRAFDRRKKFRLLERLLNLRVRVQIRDLEMSPAQ